jgi:hypothetical protein
LRFFGCHNMLGAFLRDVAMHLLAQSNQRGKNNFVRRRSNWKSWNFGINGVFSYSDKDLARSSFLESECKVLHIATKIPKSCKVRQSVPEFQFGWNRFQLSWNLGIWTFSPTRERLSHRLAHTLAGTYNWYQRAQKSPPNLAAWWAWWVTSTWHKKRQSLGAI